MRPRRKRSGAHWDSIDRTTMPRAILSVSDKRGIAEFARGLVALGWEIVSTGGTARTVREAGNEGRDASDVTSHREMREGRVGALHPAVRAGSRPRRTVEADIR